MKFFIFIICLFFTGKILACNISNDEKRVCEVVLCNPMGLLKDKSRSKCLKINHNFAIWVATLGPFKKPPKCRMRNKSCEETGDAKIGMVDVEFCDALDTLEMQNNCRRNLGYPIKNPDCSVIGEFKGFCDYDDIIEP